MKWVVLAGVLALLGVAGYQGSAKLAVNADLNAPNVQDPGDDGLDEALGGLNQPDAHGRGQKVCMPHQHYDGYVYTQHRFPRTVGGELTSAIHHGYTSAGIPAKGDLSEWMIRPPSELAW